MKYIERTVIAAFSIVGIFFLIEFVDVTFERHNWQRLDASGWASWVQAVGSIAALGIAIYVMSRQNAHAANLVIDADRRATLRRVNSVHAILSRYSAQLGIAAQSLRAHIGRTNNQAEFKRSLKAALQVVENMPVSLRAIPAFEIGSFEMANSICQFTEIVDNCLAGIRAMDSEVVPRPSPAVIVEIIRFTELARGALLEYERAMAQLN
jgi:hypothetical protein